jgi:hypothetical protein
VTKQLVRIQRIVRAMAMRIMTVRRVAVLG